MIIKGFSKKVILFLIWTEGLIRIFVKYPSIRVIMKTIKEIRSLRNQFSQKTEIHKIAKVGKKFFLSPNLQAWPSHHFFRNYLLIAKKFAGENVAISEEIRLVLLSITKRCSMKCEHCFEAENLNQKESLSRDELQKIVKTLQNAGLAHFQLGGGEPMMRFDDLVEILKYANKNISDFWMTTSGMHLNIENARILKQAGLTGVAISLDHFEKEKHNKFRNHPKAYDWAKEAVESSVKVGLATSLNLCVTREFCTMENLMEYAELAKRWGVAFIQILEARKAGGYANKDVELQPSHHKILEEFYHLLNEDETYKNYPIVHYHSLRQRISGCSAAGLRYIYIDTDGYINTCPFCRSRGKHILDGDLNDSIKDLRTQGCLKYRLAV